MGTASATWEKIKLATTTNQDNTKNLEESEEQRNLFEPGKNGEILIVYPQTNLIEVWDWVPPSHAKITTKCSGDTLYLQRQYRISIPTPVTSVKGKGRDEVNSLNGEEKGDVSRSIESVKYLCGSVEEGHTLLVLSKTLDMPLPYVLEIHFLGKQNDTVINQILELPSIMQEPQEELEFTIKSTELFLVVSNSKGFVYVFKTDGDKFYPGNFDMNLLSIRKSSSLPILNQNHLMSKLTEEEILLKTSCSDNKPIFDIVGNWLVYSPTKFEYDHLKIVSHSNDKMLGKFVDEHTDPIYASTTKDNNQKEVSIFTPVRLPPPGPLLNRVISTLSNNALDGLFKLSEASSYKVRAYLNKDRDLVVAKDEQDINQSLNSISKSIGKALYSTASSTVSNIQKKTMSLQSNDNQLVKIIDLSNDKVMGIFKPPGGISSLSLSPFDLQLVHSSFRGDNFFMWDLYKLPNEISLLGKFNRGKTSAIIKEIFWFINSYDDTSIIQGNNIGFGCITKSTGSVHWFNINYLSGDLTNNYPNNLAKDNLKHVPPKGQFLDSWVLSSINASKFISLPNIANNINSKCKSDTKFDINQLAILDSKNQIKLISPLNGSHLFKYELPKYEVNQEAISEQKFLIPDQSPTGSSINSDSITPLSQAEIETCAPYANLINNKNIQFSTYNFGHGSTTDFESFLNSYSEFGSDIPTSNIEFNKGKQTDQLELLLPDFAQGLVMDQDHLCSVARDATPELVS